MMKSQVSENREQRSRVFVDAHVHIHDCFGIQDFLDAAARNFSRHASNTVPTVDSRFVLCLTESYGVDKFDELTILADACSANTKETGAAWSFDHTGDDERLIAGHPVLGKVEIVAGRQIVTAERLEVLALGSVEIWEDGLPASDIIESVIISGAIPVLPWGFGKWLGRRRRVVNALIDTFGEDLLHVGDNSGRPNFIREPSEFALAREFGMKILPGSDPLPFESEFNKGGEWPSIRSLLRNVDVRIHHYGSLESPLRFVRNQVAMQYVTRVSKRRNVS
jgi:hypothetical protein